MFVKDMAYYLVGRLDTIQYIPEGYVHTFLLRDPKKSVYSLYKMSLNKDLTGKALSNLCAPIKRETRSRKTRPLQMPDTTVRRPDNPEDDL